MSLSVELRRADISDETQKNPVTVDIFASAHSDSPAVLAARGTDEVDRHVVKCECTRADVAALLAKCNVTNKAELPAAVLALLSPPLTVP